MTAPKKALYFSIPRPIVQIGLLALIIVNLILIVFIAQAGLSAVEGSVKLGAGFFIGVIQVFTLSAYRAFLKWVWDVK